MRVFGGYRKVCSPTFLLKHLNSQSWIADMADSRLVTLQVEKVNFAVELLKFIVKLKIDRLLHILVVLIRDEDSLLLVKATCISHPLS